EPCFVAQGPRRRVPSRPNPVLRVGRLARANARAARSGGRHGGARFVTAALAVSASRTPLPTPLQRKLLGALHRESAAFLVSLRWRTVDLLKYQLAYLHAVF